MISNMTFRLLLLITTFGLIFLCSPSISAQSVSAKANLYESVAGEFKIGFPSKPKVDTIESNTSFGENKIVTYILPTAVAFYSVTHTDFPAVMDDKYDLNIRFDVMRDAQAKQFGARVVEDSELYFGSYYGRKNVYETPKETYSTRAFVVGPRLFVLIVGTKGRLSSQSDRLRQANQKRIDTFFDSFAVTNVPTAKTAPVELPADFGISVNAGKFQSQYFELSLQSPKGWIFLDRKHTELILDLGKEAIKDSNPAQAEYLTDKTYRVLAMFSKNSLEAGLADAFMTVLVERIPYPNFLPSAVTESYLKVYREPHEKIIYNPQTTRVKDLEFSWIETFDPQTKLYHRLFVTNRRGMAFEISMNYKSRTDLQTMLNSMETLSLNDTSRPK